MSTTDKVNQLIENEKEEIIVSEFSSIKSKQGSDRSLFEVLEEFKYRFSTEINKIKHTTTKKGYDALKKKLPCVTFSAKFLGVRRKNAKKVYTKIIILDFDNVENLQTTKTTISHDSYTLACFVSPGGKGLKVLVKTDAIDSDHEFAFNLVKNHYEKLTGVDIDPSGKDVSRACFVSCDPNLYINKNSKVFNESNAPKPKIVHKKSSKPKGGTTSKKSISNQNPEVEELSKYISAVTPFKVGSRNDHLMRVSYWANRIGIDRDKVIEYFLEKVNDDFTNKEVQDNVNGVYEREKGEHGTTKYNDQIKNEGTPFIPLNVYLQLPEPLRGITAYFENQRIKDLVLLSALTSISSIAYCISGEFSREPISPNMYAMIVAPPASGKGKARRGLDLLEALDNELSSEIKQKEESNIVHIIAGNNSTANIIQRLQNNDGTGMIFESEGDTISNNLKSEWGDYTAQLRSAFHNEPISYERKSDNIKIKIPHPKPSLLITMTPGQVKSLMNSVENGMFSRVIWYAFNEYADYKSPRPCVDCDISEKDFVTNSSYEILNRFKKLRSSDIKFTMTDEQWYKFDVRQEKRIECWTKEYGDEIRDTILRIGAIMFKTMMTLTWLRLDLKSIPSEVVCDNKDLEIAIEMTDTLFYHSLYIRTNILGSKSSPKAPERVQDILDSLDKEFTTRHFLDMADKLKIPVSTAEKWLGKYKDKYYLKTGQGNYEKK